MNRVLNIGIIDDDSTKVTHIITNLLRGIKGATPEKNDKYSQYTFNPIEITIKQKIDSMLEEISEKQLDCLLIDYKLSSYANVNYSGIELAKYVNETHYDFPIFILTSYEDDLFSNEIFNAYQVFDFSRYLSEDAERIELNFKIVEQVIKTEKQREQWIYEFKKLLPLAGSNQEIDSRLLELDSKLEKSINGRLSLPLKIKQDLSSNKLTELLDKIDQLLDKE